MITLEPLWSDYVVWTFVAFLALYVVAALRNPHTVQLWRYVFGRPMGAAAAVILLSYAAVAVLDSVHFRVQPSDVDSPYQTQRLYSAFDFMIAPLGMEEEKTYSAPFALTLLQVNTESSQPAEWLTINAGKLDSPQWPDFVFKQTLYGVGQGILIWLIVIMVLMMMYSLWHRLSLWIVLQDSLHRPATRAALLTSFMIIALFVMSLHLSQYFHVFGTDKVGQDVYYQTLKSIRTGLVIGALTTIVMLPLAISGGMLAGFYRGWTDDVIQYIYTTVSAIPGVLLIAAAVLALQIVISTHGEFFSSISLRADVRLLALCLILGMTSWTGLCRLLRAETMKLREMDFVKAARSLGVSSRHILWRHILPNITHIILITVVLDFSQLVLAEAVLSYVGVGVDPTTMSWGNMINAARLEMAREPIVWWPILAAFIFMFALVLSANVFSDAVRDAFDPKGRQ